MVRRPPRPKIIKYQDPKTASGGGGSKGGGGGGSRNGGSGGGNDGGFRAGQNLLVRVVNPEPGGYAVLLVNYNLPGFLPTQTLLHSGEEILAQFVCVHNHRILLTARFSNNVSKLAATPNVRWEEFSIPFIQAIQLKQEASAEAAFGVWTSVPRKLHYKRATDLILPPIDENSRKEFKLDDDDDLEWLITELEGGKRTGCVKATSQPRQSRSAMLLFQGRVVGCIHSSKLTPDTQPTEQSLKRMLDDLETSETVIEVYDVAENVILAMSALFLGYPVQRNDDYDARKYMDYICSWFESKSQTACLAITQPSFAATCLGFMHKGEFIGAFNIESQEFNTDKVFVYDLLRKDSRSNVEASLLPTEMTSSAVRFGFSLSMANKQRKNNS